MKLPRGHAAIGTIKEREVYVDWDELLSRKGGLAASAQRELALGGLFYWAGILLLVAAVVLAVLSGTWKDLGILIPRQPAEILFWLAAFCYCVSAFLRRTQLGVRPLPLTSLASRWEAQRRWSWDEMISDDLWLAWDDGYFHHYEEFIIALSRSVLAHPEGVNLLSRLGVAPRDLEATLQSLRGRPTDAEANFPGLYYALCVQALQLQVPEIDIGCAFFVLAKTWWTTELLKLGVTAAELQALELWQRNRGIKYLYEKLWEKQSLLKPVGAVNRAYTSRYAPTLETFGRDLTKEAAQGGFNLSIGRETELAALIKILQRDHNPAVALVGEPGVGKTRLLQHLAVRMVVEDVPMALRDKRLVVFNLNKAFTEARTVEAFKILLQDLLAEVAETKNVILVFEEFEQVLEIREDLKAEVANVIQNGITKTGIKVIATLDQDGYQRLLRPLKQLASAFEVIALPQPDANLALQILIDTAPDLEAKFEVRVLVDALRQIVLLAPKYAYERAMPDKGVDLLEESMIAARDQGLKFVSAETVSEVVSKKLGVQVGNLAAGEGEKLLHLEEKMHQRVVGQNAAIRAVAAALRRNRAGLSGSNKPIASFLFFGPTGVGKTEVARTLAATYYGDPKFMVRLDMSEFQEEKNVSRLLGEMSGREFTGGQLTEPLRSRPFSLVLLDEIEKAHPKVLDLFLQVLDEGLITDGAGRKVSFQNAIIIATSNAGSRELAELIGKGLSYEEVNREVQPILRQIFRVEFLNRFDKVIMFEPLRALELARICELMLTKLAAKLDEQGIEFTWGEQLVSGLVEKAYNPLYGARELNRIVQEQVEDKIAEQMIRGELKSGGKVNL